MVATKSSVFWWSDWEADETLRLCSLAAQGLWMRMLCICAKAEPRGYLVAAGRKLSPSDIAAIVGRPEPEIKTLFDELERNGVFSYDRNGVPYCRRMQREQKRYAKRSQEGKKAAKRRWANHKENKGENSQNIGRPMGAPRTPAHGSPMTPSPSPSPLPESNERSSEQGAARESANELLDTLIEAADGNVAHGAYGVEVVAPIMDLQAAGCDLAEDILPAVREVVPKLEQPLRTWGARFLRDAILARQAARLRKRGMNGNHAPTKPRTQEEKWRIEWTWYKTKGEWPFETPDPKQLGFEIPKSLRDKWDAEDEANKK